MVVVVVWRIQPGSKFKQFETIINLKRSHNNFIKPDNQSVKNRAKTRIIRELTTKTQKKRKN